MLLPLCVIHLPFGLPSGSNDGAELSYILVWGGSDVRSPLGADLALARTTELSF